MLHVVEETWGAPSARHYHILELADFMEHHALQPTETILATLRENIAYISMKPLLDICVEVNEGEAGGLCQGPSESGLSTPHKPNDENRFHESKCFCQLANLAKFFVKAPAADAP